MDSSGIPVEFSGIPWNLVEFGGIPWHSMPILFPNPECPDLRNSMEFHQNPLEFHWNPPNSMEFHRNASEFTGIHRILYFLSFADEADAHRPARTPCTLQQRHSSEIWQNCL